MLQAQISRTLRDSPSNLLGAIRDSSRDPDALGAVFADPSWSALLDVTLRDDLSSESLRERLSDALKRLASDSPDSSHWATVHAILAHNPPPSDLLPAMREVILRTSFGDIYSANPEHGVVALMAASVQT